MLHQPNLLNTLTMSSAAYVAVETEDPIEVNIETSNGIAGTLFRYGGELTNCKLTCFSWTIAIWAGLLVGFMIYFTDKPVILISLLACVNIGIPMACIYWLSHHDSLNNLGEEHAIREAPRIHIRVVNPIHQEKLSRKAFLDEEEFV